MYHQDMLNFVLNIRVCTVPAHHIKEKKTVPALSKNITKFTYSQYCIRQISLCVFSAYVQFHSVDSGILAIYQNPINIYRQKLLKQGSDEEMIYIGNLKTILKYSGTTSVAKSSNIVVFASYLYRDFGMNS
jgi:hypothetical protein